MKCDWYDFEGNLVVENKTAEEVDQLVDDGKIQAGFGLYPDPLCDMIDD